MMASSVSLGDGDVVETVPFGTVREPRPRPARVEPESAKGERGAPVPAGAGHAIT
jgi:hypothetical protein